MLNARALIPGHDVLFVSLDSLRFDVAQDAWLAGKTPNLARVLPSSGWEMRHSPGTFTFASHMAFFAGFLPTPIAPRTHPRLFAARFEGSETTSENTLVFDTPDIVSGFAALNYSTICIGGVGFFNKRTPLGNVLPNLFQHSFWSPEMSVTDADSTENQVALAIDVLQQARNQRVFLFLNVSAMHQPNCIFLPAATHDSKASQTAALCYVDGCLPQLFHAMQKRAPVLAILCSDHGTAYGEDGYFGHRLAHPTVWNVPYVECILPRIA